MWIRRRKYVDEPENCTEGIYLFAEVSNRCRALYKGNGGKQTDQGLQLRPLQEIDEKMSLSMVNVNFSGLEFVRYDPVMHSKAQTRSSLYLFLHPHQHPPLNLTPSKPQSTSISEAGMSVLSHALPSILIYKYNLTP